MNVPESGVNTEIIVWLDHIFVPYGIQSRPADCEQQTGSSFGLWLFCLRAGLTYTITGGIFALIAV